MCFLSESGETPVGLRNEPLPFPEDPANVDLSLSRVPRLDETDILHRPTVLGMLLDRQGRRSLGHTGLSLSGGDTLEKVGIMVEEPIHSGARASGCRSGWHSSRRSIEKRPNFVAKASKHVIPVAEASKTKVI